MPAKTVQALTWPVYRPRGWGTPSRGRALERPWYGFDTERDAAGGQYVCGWAVNDTCTRVAGLGDLPAGTHFVYNLAYDVEGMLRDVGLEEAWAAAKDATAFELPGHGEARYFHGKRFDLKRPDGTKVIMVEAAAFFGRVPLKKLGKKYGAKDDRVDASRMSLAQYQRDADYRRLVDEYCQQDARIVYSAVVDLGMGVRALGVELAATPGATARRFLARMGQFPRVLWDTHTPFLRAYCGGRFELTKRGVVDRHTYQYDIVSAYPWALTQCPWLTDTARQRWGHRVSDDALYGAYRCRVTQRDDYLGVVPVWRHGVRAYSKAQDDCWLTLPEVRWLQAHGADVRVKRACEVFDAGAGTLWRDVVTELFALKKARKEHAEGLGAKIILNSMYGVLIQLVPRAGEWVPVQQAVDPVDFVGDLALERPPQEFESGKYYAPLYASTLTALTRLKLLDAALAVGDSAYIGGHTDSILTTRRLPDSWLGKDLGQWALECDAPEAQVCKTGVYAVGDKVKIRGITRDGSPAMLWHDEHTRKARVGIKSAATWDRVSLIIPKSVNNNFEIDKKRVWERDLTHDLITRREFVDSEAVQHV